MKKITCSSGQHFSKIKTDEISMFCKTQTQMKIKLQNMEVPSNFKLKIIFG
jgi:hypothetical protein